MSKQSEYGNITATLRLLRLLVKYSGELKQHMETPLSETPTNPWRSKHPAPQKFVFMESESVENQSCASNKFVTRSFSHKFTTFIVTV